MTEVIVREITADQAGCWFAGASNRSADELNAAVIAAAFVYGWQPADRDEIANVIDPLESWDGSWLADGEDSNYINESAWSARDYLNTKAPEGYSFIFDDGFYMLANCAQEFFDARWDDCPHGTCCPDSNRAHSWVAGIMVVSDEDVAEIDAQGRKVECERCERVYR